MTVASSENSNICLAPSDSAEETAAQVAHFTGASHTAAVQALWTGAFYNANDVPVGRDFSKFRLFNGAITEISRIDAGGDGLNNLRRAALRVHNFYDGLSEALEGREARLWRSSIVQKAHDIIAEMHRATYIIIGRRVSSLSRLTISQRLLWCRQVLLGPSDLRDLNPVTDRDAIIHRIYEIISASSFMAPDSPYTYINPLATPAPSPVSLVDAFGLSGTGNYTPEAGGDPQAGLGLDASITYTGLDIYGSWTRQITA